jgi:hypothetical protein
MGRLYVKNGRSPAGGAGPLNLNPVDGGSTLVGSIERYMGGVSHSIFVLVSIRTWPQSGK